MVIQLRDMSKMVDDELVLNDVTMTFEPNLVYSVLGRGKSGKTTLLRMLAGLRLPSEGEVVIPGQASIEGTFYLQHHDVIYSKRMTLKKIIKTIKSCYSDFNDAHCDELLKRHGLGIKRRFHQLSTHEKVLFQQSLALSVGVSYLLLDEPVIGMTEEECSSFYEELKQSMMREPKTAILTTQEVAGLEKVADHVIILEDGQITLSERINVLSDQSYLIKGDERAVRKFLQKEELLGLHYRHGEIEAYILSDQEPNPEANVTIEHIDLDTLFKGLTERDVVEEGIKE